MSELSPLIEEIIQSGGEVVFTITGDSMAPMLYHRRDKVCIIKASGKQLNKYDIPLYVRKNGNYIIHRIVAVKERGYVTMGDNQVVKEYPVISSQVIGVVKGFWRKGKYVSCDDLRYRIYCRFWNYGYPLRRLFLRGKHLCAYLINGIY
jgi:signal peptidase I